MADTSTPDDISLGWIMTAVAGAITALWSFARGQNKERIEELKSQSTEHKTELVSVRERLEVSESRSNELDKRLAAMEVRVEVSEKAGEVLRTTLTTTHTLANRAIEVSGSAVEFITQAREELRQGDDSNS